MFENAEVFPRGNSNLESKTLNPYVLLVLFQHSAPVVAILFLHALILLRTPNRNIL